MVKLGTVSLFLEEKCNGNDFLFKLFFFYRKASLKSKNVFVHEIGCKSGIEDIWLLGGNNHQMLQKCISKFINNHVIFSHTYRKAISCLKISSQIFWHSNRNWNNLTSKNQYLLLSCIYGKYWYNSLFHLMLKFDYMKRKTISKRY